ncbi:MAG: hypothetical protein ACF8PN_01325 [Phycisphaerales bacterium]
MLAGARDTVIDFVRAIRTGVAPWPVKLGVSIAAAAFLASGVLMVFGMVELSGGRVHEPFGIAGVALAAAGWIGSLSYIWWPFGRFQRIVKCGFAIAAVWLVMLALSLAVSEVFPRADEFFIAGLFLLSIGLSILIMASAVYQRSATRPLVRRGGEINVQCPGCGYSMVGLHECRCPECGEAFTIDEIIRLQMFDYRVEPAVVSKAPRPEDEAPESSAGLVPVT